jgi:hypothetical protein
MESNIEKKKILYSSWVYLKIKPDFVIHEQ